MGIQIREAKSEEMRKNIRTVRQMTKGMGFDENMGKVNWSFVRVISNFGYQFMPKEKGVKYKKIRLGDTKAIISEYEQTNNKNIIMYIHGGGFVSGSASSSKGYISMLTKYSGCKVIAVDYSLAPEYAFPKGFDDCYNAFCEIIRFKRSFNKLPELRSNSEVQWGIVSPTEPRDGTRRLRGGGHRQRLYPKAKITLAGESAGANLCLALALKVKKTGRLSCVLVHSPIVDFTGSLNRTEHTVDDFTVKEGCLKPLNQIYVADNEADNPYISPLFGDFNGFPPTYITCDYNETLYADAKALYIKCEQQMVDVELVEVKGTFHAFATIVTGTPETQQILEESIAFMNKYI